jgi:predicted nucleotidyltransferase component of viral defense system
MRATKETPAGRRYLDLQREARRTIRPTDELIQLYALECFLDRLTRSEFAENFVLKGGVLLAALDARRPTRDIDFAARAIDNDTIAVLRLVRQIAALSLDDGIEFDVADAIAETIRDEDAYSGVRVTLSGTLSRATLRLHVDVNVGDPIWPEPQNITLPRLLDGALIVRGYPLEMVLAEKIVTAIARGAASTRWRDFVDLYMLVQRHPIESRILKQSMSGWRGIAT